MTQVKYLFMAIIAICLTTTVNAQTTQTTKKTTSKKVKKSKKSQHMHTVKFQCPMKCEGDKTYDHAGKCPVCGMNLKQLPAEVKTIGYQCPMKCEGDKTYAAAGKCPVCNMNLKEMSAKKEKKSDEHNHPHH